MMGAGQQVGVDMEVFGIRFRPTDFDYVQDGLVRID